MDSRVILSKIVTLIYRSRLVNNNENDDLARTILNTIKTDAPEFNFNGHNTIKRLKEFAIEMLEEKDEIAKEVITQSLALILENDSKLLGIIKDSIDPEYDDASNKRIITSLVKMLNNYYKEHLAIEILNKANYDLKFNRGKITNFSEYLKNTLADLEPLTSVLSTLKDPAVVNEIDFDNPESVTTVFEEVKSLNNTSGVYKLGFQDINTMTQGGIRRGESVGIEALQHKYKTGFSLTAFMQLALENTPIVTKEEAEAGKKPLLVRISFEDNLTNNLQFMYQYLKAEEGIHITARDFGELSAEEMTAYITARLSATGFKIKMRRVDPSQWTVSSLMNYIIELEAQGYAVHVLMCDYLLKMPTTGCLQGAAGQDKRDMVRRVRNFCSARNIAFISPYQLSTEAKQLIRNGVPEHQFVNEIAEKGYTDGCKTIDQELDLELYIHLFTHKRRKYLSVRRGKHRLSTVIADEDKYTIYRFPGLNIPILGDLRTENTGMKKLPKDFEDSGDNILEEVLA